MVRKLRGRNNNPEDTFEALIDFNGDVPNNSLRGTRKRTNDGEHPDDYRGEPEPRIEGVNDRNSIDETWNQLGWSQPNSQETLMIQGKSFLNSP